MENPFKKSLNKIIKKEAVDLSSTSLEKFQNEQEMLEQVLHNEAWKHEEKPNGFVEIRQKGDELEDLIEDLDEVEINEIDYLNIQKEMYELDNQIQEMNIDLTQLSQDEAQVKRQEIEDLQKQYKDLENSLEWKEYVQSYNPGRIKELTEELEKNKNFLENYYQQLDNYFKN